MYFSNSFKFLNENDSLFSMAEYTIAVNQIYCNKKPKLLIPIIKKFTVVLNYSNSLQNYRYCMVDSIITEDINWAT